MILIFSYGSNSLAQLRARVENMSLEARSASLEGFARVFCLRVPAWGESGVASLAPCAGAVTHGSVVSLTPEEKARLDRYEGGYREERVTVRVDGEESGAIAYIAGTERPEPGAPFTLPLAVPPSEQYLTAVHAHLRAHRAMDSEAIAICSCDHPDGSVRTVGEWRHPGVRALSLEALCVELSCRLPTPWKMPRAIGEACGRLRAAGIASTEQLVAAPREETEDGAAGASPGASLNLRIAASSPPAFAPEELRVLSELLLGGEG